MAQPMATDRRYNTTKGDIARTQLISPPPEETFRRQFKTPHQSPPTTSKRKRTQPAQSTTPQVPEATPNPKPRKQGRHLPTASPGSPTRKAAPQPHISTPSKFQPTRVVIQSPHTLNPNADYIPPLQALCFSPEAKPKLPKARTRRSETPIPPYEPPTDVFSPPREVFLTAAPSTTSRSGKKRTSTAPASTARMGSRNKKALQVVTVKLEMPEIDLTLPMPPASPTDDPILLYGPERDSDIEILNSPPKSFRSEASIQADLRDDPPQPKVWAPSPPPPQDLPPSSPMVWDHSPMSDARLPDQDESMHHRDVYDEPTHLFDSDPAFGAGHWSDNAAAADDDDDDDNTSFNASFNASLDISGPTYEERWTEFVIPTKMDPPSSTTKLRMNDWGTPISPLPKPKRLSDVGEEEGQDSFIDAGDNDPSSDHQHEEEDQAEEEEVARISVEPEERDLTGETSIDSTASQSFKQPDEDEQEEQEVTRMSMEPEALPDDPSGNTSASLLPEVEEEEERQVREMSVDYGDEEVSISIEAPAEPPVESTPSPEQQAPSPPPTAADPLDSDIDDDASLIKITSADPRAAARAAAILKQHDYDCFTRLTAAKERRISHATPDSLARRSRLRDVTGSGIGKNKRRPAAGMGVIGDQVIIPGSPVISLPDLVQQAEQEFAEDHWHAWHAEKSHASSVGTPSRFTTPRRSMSRGIPAGPTIPEPSESGERMWTKDDWKLLDACFTDERLAVGAELDDRQLGLAPVSAISISNVVDRYIEALGGQEVVDSFGEEWSRENLSDRARALRRKQRSGNCAPPSAPGTPRAGSPFTPHYANPRHTLVVPDFTPLARPGLVSLPRQESPSLSTTYSPFFNIQQRALPPTLLAPRYSHLLEEAKMIAAEHGAPKPPPALEPKSEDPDTSAPPSPEPSVSVDVTGTPRTMASRMKGFLFSYLPTTTKKPAPPSRIPQPAHPGLPLPPPEVLEKPRGPIITPARMPIPKAKPHKELVHLHPAPQPPPPSHIPRMSKPRRLVDLHPVTPPPPPPSEPRPRRSSGSSVKDLIQNYEGLKKQDIVKPFIPKLSKLVKPSWRP